MTETVVGTARRPVAKVVGAAVALGVLAFAADSVDGVAGRVVVALVSSGLAWGLAAVLAGRAGAGARSAMIGATVLLVSATLVYYLLILVVSRRWSGGNVADGLSGDLHGLRSVAVMTLAWLVISVVAGPVLGLLGWLTRAATTARAALAAGVACGLLSGDGWQRLTGGLSWHLPASIDPGFAAAWLVLPLAVLVWLATTRRLWRAWPILLGATIFSAALSAVLWQAMRDAANQIG